MLGFNAIGTETVGASGLAPDYVQAGANAPGASLSGAGSFTGGAAAAGPAPGVNAPGATMSGAGSITGGAPSAPGNASGATMSGAGSVTGGAAASFIPPLPVNPAMLYAMPGSGWNFPDLIAGDVATLSFDFKDEIPAGVTIASAAAHPVVHIGIDPNPAALITGDPTVDGSVVSVRAHAFVAGCAYWPRVTATLSDGQAITYPIPGEGSLRVVA